MALGLQPRPPLRGGNVYLRSPNVTEQVANLLRQKRHRINVTEQVANLLRQKRHRINVTKQVANLLRQKSGRNSYAGRGLQPRPPLRGGNVYLRSPNLMEQVANLFRQKSGRNYC
jgi:hypothetical protein